MKQVATIVLLFLGTSCSVKDTELDKSNNGLIYSDTTVKKLKFIVDSLNLKFKECELSKTYLSKSQAKSHFISLKTGKIKDAKKDIEANISFDDFLKKYSNSHVEKDLLVVKYKNYNNIDVIEFSSAEIHNINKFKFFFSKKIEIYDEPLKGNWIYQYKPKTEYSKESLTAFYFIEDFTLQPIPEVYARMIQYSDYMIDTSTQIFHEKAYRFGINYRNEESSKPKEFLDYIYKSTSQPEYNPEFTKKDFEQYKIQYQIWDSLRISMVDRLKNKDEKFSTLLSEAVKDAIKKGGTNDEFEEYVGRYYSKKTALELKRNRIVIGTCSTSSGPIDHTLNIAKLSAETTTWEIFIRSHLDIMNDRFERIGYGSYAQDKRKTYIKELELLDINVLDLLLGISLRIENPSNNHYYGNIELLGMALTETNKATEIEAKMLEMISDNQLDDYNRVLIYYLFQNYTNNLDDKQKQIVAAEKLMTAVKTLPEYLTAKLKTEK